jgi:hypothetical protein
LSTLVRYPGWLWSSIADGGQAAKAAELHRLAVVIPGFVKHYLWSPRQALASRRVVIRASKLISLGSELFRQLAKLFLSAAFKALL